MPDVEGDVQSALLALLSQQPRAGDAICRLSRGAQRRLCRLPRHGARHPLAHRGSRPPVGAFIRSVAHLIDSCARRPLMATPTPTPRTFSRRPNCRMIPDQRRADELSAHVQPVVPTWLCRQVICYDGCARPNVTGDRRSDEDIYRSGRFSGGDLSDGGRARRGQTLMMHPYHRKLDALLDRMGGLYTVQTSCRRSPKARCRASSRVIPGRSPRSLFSRALAA